MSESPAPIDERDIGVQRPNYLARRLIVTAALVAVIAVIAVVVGRMIDDDGSDGGAVDVDTSWDTVVTINERTGRIAMSAPDGSAVETISANTGAVSDAAMVGDTAFIIGARTSVAIDLTGDNSRVDVSGLLDGEITLSRPAGTIELVVFSNGTDGVVMAEDLDALIDTAATVDAPGVRLDLAAATANVDGSALLIPDLGNFQSVLVRFGDEPASYFAGVPLAVDGDRVATAQTVGGNATVTLSDHDGTELFQSTTKPVLAAMLVDEGILTIDSSGMIHRLTMDDDDVIGALGASPVAGESWVASTGDRLIVTTARGVSVVDESGEVIANPDGGAPATTGPAPASTVPLRPGCVPLHSASSGDFQLLDLRDGESLAESTAVGADVLTSADGCIAVAAESEATGEGVVAISADGTTPLALDGAEAVALSPDGETIVVARSGRLVAEPLSSDEDDGEDADNDGDEDADDLGTVTPHVFFADL